MGNFRPRDRNFNDGPVTLHQATCSQCGKECEIPFMPRGGRPVYCSNCFEEKKRNGDLPGARRGGFVPRRDDQKIEGPSNKQVVEQLINLNSKMDRLLAALEPKTPVEKPKVPKKKAVEAVVSPTKGK